MQVAPFTGTVQLEQSERKDDFILWKQKDHLLAAVNRYNVVCFWNTVTGRLIHKKLLGERAKLPDAYKYRYHMPEYGLNYRDPAYQFNDSY